MYAIRSYYAPGGTGSGSPSADIGFAHQTRSFSPSREENAPGYGRVTARTVITSYSIHYTKLYENREQELWRLLLTSDSTDRIDETKIMEELTDTPTLLEAILRRAKEAESRGDSPVTEKAPVSGEVLRKVVGRLSGFVRVLPEDRKKQVLSSIDAGLSGPGPGA